MLSTTLILNPNTLTPVIRPANQVDAGPTLALRQMLNLGGGAAAGGAPLRMMHPPPQQQQQGPRAAASPGEAIMDMLHVRRGYVAVGARAMAPACCSSPALLTSHHGQRGIRSAYHVP